ncbi:MAG: NUDIX hydrolase [Caldisericia bacterium]|nr:NUDIX hydrolase [Caldisericia bacterium]
MKKIHEKFGYKGKWVGVLEKTFACNNGELSHWEVVTRVKHPISMTMIAQLQPSGRIVLIRQYRPTIENWVIAFPAGLSESDDIATQATRELKEETGYTGKVVRVSPRICSNAGLFSDFMHVVELEVDENDPINANVMAQLESSEEIEVVLLQPAAILPYLLEQNAKGVDISVGVWYSFALYKGR